MSDKEKEKKKGTNISRRSFLKGVGTGTVAATVAPAAVLVGAPEKADAQTDEAISTAEIQLNINDQVYQIEVEARTTLLSVLRDGIDTEGNYVDLTGAKLICDKGECGGCTVLVDGKPVYACMMLAMDAQGKQITTVEGIANGDELHPVQDAFIQHDASMCGFCTPGFIVSSVALLNENKKPTLAEIKDGLSGNTCRCGTYPFIFDAVETASEKM
ncbi:MAG: (2Fe-2S)-binding protein [Candidatus Poribacteria bacterium]|nr:(2Fe-2S)-binding protein [Candidatus Poribacteria bacterium]